MSKTNPRAPCLLLHTPKSSVPPEMAPIIASLAISCWIQIFDFMKLWREAENYLRRTTTCVWSCRGKGNKGEKNNTFHVYNYDVFFMRLLYFKRIINVLLARTILPGVRSLSKTHKKNVNSTSKDTARRRARRRPVDLWYEWLHQFFSLALNSRLHSCWAPKAWSRFANYSSLILPLFVLSSVFSL